MAAPARPEIPNRSNVLTAAKTLSLQVVLCPPNGHSCCHGIRHGDTGRRSVTTVLKKREGSWDGRCHFEPWSDDKDGTLAGTLSKLPHHTSGGTLGTADLLENRVSSLEPSGPETETLSLCR
ncbi:hypothetical protein AVEN_16351-1 [Araneus ventricosus]|uniref:Uncharacterized protein n=2 Tax=Araneus ventricosus TaxID=182803 RepID=A0A4Y2GS19_ARAVE|nr:hypothetical protein AVEN_16351-1 [Araneus ventricosus]